MCDRAAVIKDGEIKAVEQIQSLLEKQMKKVRVVFDKPPLDQKLPDGSQLAKWNNSKLTFEYVGPINRLIDWLNLQDLHDAVLEEPDLESIFMNYYER